MLGNSSQHPEFGHFTLECALNSSFHWFIRERGMSRTAWFSAFGLPFFFPSVLSLAEFPGSKQSGAWLGTVCPLWTTGIPIVQETARLSGCTISPTPKGQEAQTESWLTHIKAQGLELTQVKSLATTG